MASVPAWRARTGPGSTTPMAVVGQSLPGIALVVIFAICAVLQPDVLSLNGLALLLSPAIPLVLASISQMFIITMGDIDLGNGYLIGLITAVVAVFMGSRPLLGFLLAVGIGGLYVGQAVLVEVRRIPSIIVTLGASFIWLGIGLAILPTPGGNTPEWLVDFANLTVPQTSTLVLPIPMALILAAVIGALAYVLIIRMPYGAVIRAAGSNADAVRRAGWSVLKARMTAYGVAAFFAILAGIALAAVISNGDPTTSANYTLLTVAAVILGGSQFSGGRAVPFGAVIGALAISLVTSMLSLLQVSSNFQTGVQGAVLVAVLAGRILTDRRRA